MNRNSLITVAALALTIASAATASAQRADRQERPRGVQADSGFGRRSQGGRGPQAMLLRGITLSESQKTRLAAISKGQHQEMDVKRVKETRERDAQTRTTRERGDSNVMNARRAEMEKRREQRVAAIRSILNAAQRQQFDKNVAELTAHTPQRRGAR